MQDLQTTRAQTPLEIIVQWSTSLPNWQQDALRRIIELGDVNGDDIDELVALSLSENSVKETELVAKPIEEGYLPRGGTQAQTVTLSSISDVENANALDSKQQLTFGGNGLTVVFGNNGSGKSGYGRIFRRACRSRSKGSAILPNILQTGDDSPANAIITYRLDGTEQSPEQWIDGQRPVDALGAVSFFDADCALEHVRSKNDIAFTPFGLDILPKLGSASKKVQAKLDEMRRQFQSSKPSFLSSHFATGDHEVGQFLSRLNEDSDLKVLEALAVLTPDHRKRLQEIPKLLGTDPREKAKALKTNADLLDGLQKSLAEANSLLDDSAVENLKKLAKDATAKKSAAAMAASKHFANDPLDGVGTDVWKQLWNAARDYSQIAYPDGSFPETGGDKHCLLCQQQLNDDAQERLKRFEQFVSDQTEKQAQQAVEKLNQGLLGFNNFILESEKFAFQMQQLKELHEDLHEDLVPITEALRLRKRELTKAAQTNEWPVKGPVELDDITAKFDSLRTTLLQEIDKHKQLVGSDERKRLTKELEDLRAREWLATVVKDVKAELLRMVRIQQLNNCIAETKTNRITAKSKELAQQFVTDQLRNAFADEIRKMHQGTRRLNVELAATSGAFGSSNYRVQLVGATDSEIGMVVSEGEHRCIALAGFLSELTTENSQSAIVFDDPVTSLDHNWRDCFAKRLVEEAEIRQVIVFTHDVVFLHDLLTRTDRTSVPCHIQRLHANATSSGLVSDELPWFGKKVPQRIDELEQNTRRAKREYDAQNDDIYEREIGFVYSRLRATVERSVEEVLFRGVVIRHRDYVNLKSLKPVAALDLTECNDLLNLFQKCCDVTEAHDRAMLKSFGIPTPDDAFKDIEELKRVVKVVKDKQSSIS